MIFFAEVGSLKRPPKMIFLKKAMLNILNKLLSKIGSLPNPYWKSIAKDHSANLEKFFDSRGCIQVYGHLDDFSNIRSAVEYIEKKNPYVVRLIAQAQLTVIVIESPPIQNTVCNVFYLERSRDYQRHQVVGRLVFKAVQTKFERMGVRKNLFTRKRMQKVGERFWNEICFY